MKAKNSYLEIIAISLIVLLNTFLMGLNVTDKSYKAKSEFNSKPNYVDIEKEEIKEETKEEIKEETIEKKEIVYDNMTLEELSEKINKSLNSTISGKGYLIASYSLEKGVDPYMATAIILHETGCKWECSYLVRKCNNVGGQKGSGCGSYSYFTTLDDGIKAFIDNLNKNYISYGLTTPEKINPKYAEDTRWASKVNKYIENIKSS